MIAVPGDGAARPKSPTRLLLLGGLTALVVLVFAVATAQPPEVGLTSLQLTRVAVGPLDLSSFSSEGPTDWLQVLHRLGFGLQAHVEVHNPNLLLPVALVPGAVALEYAGLQVDVSQVDDAWVLPLGRASLPVMFFVDNILTIDGRTASTASQALAANAPLLMQVGFNGHAQVLLRSIAVRGSCTIAVQLCPADLCHQSADEVDLLNAAVFAGVVASGGSPRAACLAEQAASGCFAGLSSGARTAEVRVVSCAVSAAGVA